MTHKHLSIMLAVLMSMVASIVSTNAEKGEWDVYSDEVPTESSYSITLSSCDHGTISSLQTNAANEQTVIIKVAADKGYKLKQIYARYTLEPQLSYPSSTAPTIRAGCNYKYNQISAYYGSTGMSLFGTSSSTNYYAVRMGSQLTINRESSSFIYSTIWECTKIAGQTSYFVPTQSSNHRIELSYIDDNTYSFTMPSDDVVVYAEFEEADCINLTDGTVFTNDMEQDVDELTYTRNFTNTNWQALYVPFEMQYEDWKDDFELARINNVNQYDDNEDGDVDRTVLEVFKVKSGQTEAHTPYLIKAKTTGEKAISLTNATLYKAEEKSYDVSSWNTLYTFTGTYTGVSGATMFGEGYYALGGGSLHQAADATNALSPFRWYMAVTDRDGNPKNVGEVKVMVFGMEEDELIETGLEEVGRDAISTNEQPVFDLNGRRVTNPRKGLYIKNGKKFVVK